LSSSTGPYVKMRYERVTDVKHPVSKIVMGTLGGQEIDHAGTLYDTYAEQGGNTFDTAHHYGKAEAVFGEWMNRRGVRSNTVVITKGAHTPNCNPETLTTEFNQSLDLLQTDFIDIYFLHRDNPEIPVGEFVDVLNEHKRAGRLGVFGGSNWSLARMDEANEYAAKNSLAGFTVLSNHMSLARMVESPWPGCLASSDVESRNWLAERNMPLFPWSSQARGFFADGRAHPDDHSDPDLVRSWYSDDNFERLARVREMASRKNVAVITIALAYVLNQSNPTFPLVGPLSADETRSSMAALDVEMTSTDLAWLNLEG